MLARLGGDEFLVLAPQTDRERLQTLAQRIIDRLKTPFRIGLIEVYTGCSIGIALCPEHGNDLDSLIRSADTAMYVAKEHGKRTYTVFSPEMNKRVAEYMWLDTNLRKGSEQNQLVLYYQPKIDARSGEVHSVEALVRWDSPERGLIPPLQFISYAEESGLIGPLGQWVLQTAAGRGAVARAGIESAGGGQPLRPAAGRRQHRQRPARGAAPSPHGPLSVGLRVDRKQPD